MVSSVWGHCEITMHYVNGLERKWRIKERIESNFFLWL
jgi:hypothetical protein